MRFGAAKRITIMFQVPYFAVVPQELRAKSFPWVMPGIVGAEV
jgi:hypothetical protein